MTSPDKPDTTSTDERNDAELERTVATAPAQASPSRPNDNGPKADGTVSGTTDTGPTNGKSTAVPKPTITAEPEAAQPTVATQPVTPPPAVPPVAGPEITSAAPPPWQRVGTDTEYLTANQPTETVEPPAARFADWGYQRSPRSEAYAETTQTGTPVAPPGAPLSGEFPMAGGPVVSGPVVSGPVVSGMAASSVFAANAGQSSVRPDARPGADPSNRTTVNFGAPPDPIRPPAGGSTPSALRRPGRGPRRASLQVKRVDPWSVLKLAFVLSVALFFVWLVAVGVLYGVLDGMGVWDRVNGTYNEFAANTAGGTNGPLITASRVFGIAAVIGAINIVLFTALATVGSFVYNVSADLAGGLEITLAERE